MNMFNTNMIDWFIDLPGNWILHSSQNITFHQLKVKLHLKRTIHKLFKCYYLAKFENLKYNEQLN